MESILFPLGSLLKSSPGFSLQTSRWARIRPHVEGRRRDLDYGEKWNLASLAWGFCNSSLSRPCAGSCVGFPLPFCPPSPWFCCFRLRPRTTLVGLGQAVPAAAARGPASTKSGARFLSKSRGPSGSCGRTLSSAPLLQPTQGFRPEAGGWWAPGSARY